MRYWKEAPIPGSLEESLAIAVEQYEEFRYYEYVTTIVVGAALAANGTNEAQKSLKDLLTNIHQKFFGDGKTSQRTIEDKEKEDFLKLMENHVIKLDTTRLQEAASPHSQPIEAKKIVFNSAPRGKLVE